VKAASFEMLERRDRSAFRLRYRDVDLCYFDAELRFSQWASARVVRPCCLGRQWRSSTGLVGMLETPGAGLGFGRSGAESGDLELAWWNRAWIEAQLNVKVWERRTLRTQKNTAPVFTLNCECAISYINLRANSRNKLHNGSQGAVLDWLRYFPPPLPMAR